jgi:hypothetical protein
MHCQPDSEQAADVQVFGICVDHVNTQILLFAVPVFIKGTSATHRWPLLNGAQARHRLQDHTTIPVFAILRVYLAHPVSFKRLILHCVCILICLRRSSTALAV